jgi:hypothetical protein
MTAPQPQPPPPGLQPGQTPQWLFNNPLSPLNPANMPTQQPSGFVAPVTPPAPTITINV